MRTDDLLAEAWAAFQRVRQPHIDRMLVLGVSASSIAMLGAREIPFGVGMIERMGNGLYQPGDGAVHVLSPVYADGQIIDIVAWRSDAPTKWLWRTGIGWALGTDELRPRWDNAPMPIHATPLDWLRAAGEGICVLDWDAPDLASLRTLESIEADEWLCQRLTRALSKPPRMPVIIKRREVRRAA